MDNAQKIWDKLLAAGLTPAGAAGLMGNLQAESGLAPRNLQNSFEKKLGLSDDDYTEAVDCGAYADFVTDRAGYGLAQWTYPSRKAALLAYARARGLSIGDLNMQVGYLLQELQALFKPLWDKLCSAASVREASDAVLLDFERPACVSNPIVLQATRNRRGKLAQEFYDKFTGGNSMNIIMTATAFCTQLLAIANGCKTAYMLGPWGWPANDTKKMIDCCREVSADFSTIVPAEAVWLDGHIGVYVGGGMVVECTPKWQGGVQLSTCSNVSPGLIFGTAGSRQWTKHGKLPWVDYTAQKSEKEEDDMLTYEQWKEYMDRYRKELRADHDQCWAEKELAAAVASGITDGKRPHDFVTREEAAIMALRSKG